MDTLLYPTTILSAGLCGFLGLLGFAGLYAMIDQDNREYMDPLSFKMRLIWPFIQIIANFFCVFLPYDYIEYTELRLSRTGVSYLMTAEQFIALRIISAIMVTVFAFILMISIGKFQPVFLVIAPFVGFFFPDIWLNDTRKAREGAVIRAMPVYLDFITMCVEAGLNLQGALDQAMEKAPPGPLRNEFGIVLRDLRSGLSRAESLKRMAERLDISEVTSFVSSIVQAEKMGASLATVLRVQADQRRNERFQRAEKLAMEAPIKLVGPLIMFIFPVTFIVLGFPIVMKFLGEGIL